MYDTVKEVVPIVKKYSFLANLPIMVHCTVETASLIVIWYF